MILEVPEINVFLVIFSGQLPVKCGRVIKATPIKPTELKALYPAPLSIVAKDTVVHQAQL